MRHVHLADGLAVPVEPARAELAPIGALARAIAALAREHDGRVTFHQLLGAGFDPETIAAFHPHAIPRAARALLPHRPPEAA
jgi:hypothetical protein